MDVFAEVFADDKRVAVVRAGSPNELMTDFFAHIARTVQRKRYREERQHPEWVDLGGEGGA